MLTDNLHLLSGLSARARSLEHFVQGKIINQLMGDYQLPLAKRLTRARMGKFYRLACMALSCRKCAQSDCESVKFDCEKMEIFKDFVVLKSIHLFSAK